MIIVYQCILNYQDQSDEDVEDDEEQFCSVEELDRLTGDMLDSVMPSGFEEDDFVEPLDNADDVIDELEALMEVSEAVSTTAICKPGGIIVHL
jgi:hypothetical protein